MKLKSLVVTGAFCSTIAVLTDARLLAEDPSNPSAVTPALLQSVEERYASEVAKADAVLAKAEAEVAKQKKLAAEIRLKAYKEKLSEITKTGAFDKAISIKLRIELLEREPESANERTEKTTKRARPKDLVKFQGHSYSLIREQATWHVAKQRCEEMGGKLACINDSREEKFIGELCGSVDAWVGATDEEDEGKWHNIDGSRINILNIKIDNAATGEHWLQWDGVSGHFNDLSTNARIAYVCEWDR